MNSYFIQLKTIQETLKELDKVTITKIEINSNTFTKFMKYILSKSDISKEFKTYLGIHIWQVENNQLPNNIARIKYSDGDEKIISINLFINHIVACTDIIYTKHKDRI